MICSYGSSRSMCSCLLSAVWPGAVRAGIRSISWPGSCGFLFFTGASDLRMGIWEWPGSWSR